MRFHIKDVKRVDDPRRFNSHLQVDIFADEICPDSMARTVHLDNYGFTPKATERQWTEVRWLNEFLNSDDFKETYEEFKKKPPKLSGRNQDNENGDDLIEPNTYDGDGISDLDLT